jgi:site-specific recombinase XerD
MTNAVLTLPTTQSVTGISDHDVLSPFLAGQLTPQTRRAYHADLVAFFGGDLISLDDCRSITFVDVIAYRNKLSDDGLKPATINRKLSSIRALYKVLMAAGALPTNPADAALVKGYKPQRTLRGKTISTDDISTILTAADAETGLRGLRDQAMLRTLLYAGLRRSEVVSMNWSLIHREAGHVVLELPVTKSGTPQSVKLSPVVVAALDRYRKALDTAGVDCDAVWISLTRNKGQRITDHTAYRCVLRYAEMLDIRMTPHSFRHTCATLAMEGGATPQQVQGHLRHASVTTTMQYYEDRNLLTDNATDYILNEEQ